MSGSFDLLDPYSPHGGVRNNSSAFLEVIFAIHFYFETDAAPYDTLASDTFATINY